MKNMKIFNQTMKKGVVFFIGLISIALGSVHMIQVSSLGVQPFDVYYVGLSEKHPITIGMASIGTGILLVSIALFISKEKLKIGTILDTIFLGLFVDLFLHADFIHQPFTLFGQISFIVLGTIFIAIWQCSDHPFKFRSRPHRYLHAGHSQEISSICKGSNHCH